MLTIFIVALKRLGGFNKMSIMIPNIRIHFMGNKATYYDQVYFISMSVLHESRFLLGLIHASLHAF